MQEPEGPRLGLAKQSPSALKPPGRALPRPFYKTKLGLFLPSGSSSRTNPLPQAVGRDVCSSE